MHSLLAQYPIRPEASIQNHVQHAIEKIHGRQHSELHKHGVGVEGARRSHARANVGAIAVIIEIAAIRIAVAHRTAAVKHTAVGNQHNDDNEIC